MESGDGGKSSGTVSVVIDRGFLSHLQQSEEVSESSRLIIPVSAGGHAAEGLPLVVAGDASAEELSHLLNNFLQTNSSPLVSYRGNTLDGVPAEYGPGDGAPPVFSGRLVPSPRPLLRVWCEECQKSFAEECPLHPRILIADSSQIPMAFTSCPVHFMIREQSDGGYGIVSKKIVPKKCRLGPMEAEKYAEPTDGDPFPLNVCGPNEQAVFLRRTDNWKCNWMKFIRPATSFQHQNLVAVQIEGQVYFDSIRQIQPKEELRVWYSQAYAKLMGKPLLLADWSRQNGEYWNCVECGAKMGSESEMELHLLKTHEIHLDGMPASTEQTTKRRKAPGRKETSAPPQPIGKKGSALHGALKIKNKYFKKKKLHKLENRSCPFCQRRIQSAAKMKLHQLTHQLHGDAGHICQFCWSPFFTQQQLIKHMERKHNSCSIAVCLSCNQCFSSRRLLQAHSFAHEEEEAEPQQCPAIRCRASFSSRMQLAAHVSSRHLLPELFSISRVGDSETRNVQWNVCQVCSRAFRRLDRYEAHVLSHGLEEADKPFQCSYCFKRFISPTGFSAHIKSHSSDHYFRCYICLKQFDKNAVCKQHILTHRDPVDSNFHCLKCEQEGKKTPTAFQTYEKMKQHCRYRHGGTDYRCHICGKVFPRSDKLQNHMLSHSTVKQFLCAVCGKQFKRKDKLKEHQKRMHAGQNVPAMEVTGQEMAPPPVDDVPAKQRKTKTPVDPSKDFHRYIFRCTFCMLGFRRRGMLVNHMRSKHPSADLNSVPELTLPLLQHKKLYCCIYCDKTYMSESKRKQHIQRHHPGQLLPAERGDSCVRSLGQFLHSPFLCPVADCERQYASKAHLSTHIRRAHPTPSANSSRRPKTRQADLPGPSADTAQSDFSSASVALTSPPLTAAGAQHPKFHDIRADPVHQFSRFRLVSNPPHGQTLSGSTGSPMGRQIMEFSGSFDSTTLNTPSPSAAKGRNICLPLYSPLDMTKSWNSLQ